MSTIDGMKLGAKLGWAFSVVLMLTLLVAGLGVYEMSAISANTEEIATNWLPSIKSLARMRAAANQFRRAEGDHVLATDEKEMAPIEKSMVEAKEALAKAQAHYEALIVPGEERVRYDRYQKDLDAYWVVHAKLLPLSRQGDKTMAETKLLFRTASRDAFNAAMGGVGDLLDLNDKGSKVAWDAAQVTYSRARMLLIGLALVALVLGAALAILLTRGVVRQLGAEPGEAAALAQGVAAGDLSARIDLRAGDTTSMMAAMKQMQVSLGDVVSKVRTNCEAVATASGQIAQGTMDLSSRTEEQASALEQTAASMHELGTTVRQNADNAKQANQLAQEATTVAVRGGDVVGQVVDTMNGINESSKKISDIIGVIDGIAFQTNILALNAAVEAARAGEQGRGFAVVASEVRNLAQRSADAAKEIKSLISDSVERVGRGSTLVGQAGETMKEVVTAIRRVTDLMGEISSASAEQSSSVAQVGEAVQQMDQVTQQNAALVEESAAAADSMKEQTRQLVDAVAVFKLSHEGQMMQAPPMSSRAPAAQQRSAPQHGSAALSAPRKAPPTAKKVAGPARPAPAAAKAPAQVAAASGKPGDDWETF